MKVDPGSWAGGGTAAPVAGLVDDGLVDDGLVDDGLLLGWVLVDPEPPFDPYAPDERDAIDRVAADLRRVDAAMARVLRDMAAAGPRDGLSVRRQVALLAEVTGTDVGFLDRAVQTLSAMPAIQGAFDAGRLSWSQIRGIVLEARRLAVAQRQQLDGTLVGLLDGRPGEPDRIVAVAGDVAARLDAVGQEKVEAAQDRQQRAVLQPGFDGWGELHASLCPENFAAVGEAMDALADPPVAVDAPPAADDDGRTLPKAARPPTGRAAQLAEALGRMAALVLGRGSPDGTLRRARPRVSVIAPLADLVNPTGTDAESDGGWRQDQVGSVTARLLLRRGNGRRRISRTLTQALADDADLVAIFTDAHGMPVAIGDCYAPITEAMRRAVAARDQGCRAPGCSAPVEHCDVHHVIPREGGGLTELLNLVAMCRPCHTRIRLHHWAMRLDPDGTLTTRIGRRTFTTRPRLTDRPTQPAPDRADGRQPG